VVDEVEYICTQKEKKVSKIKEVCPHLWYLLSIWQYIICRHIFALALNQDTTLEMFTIQRRWVPLVDPDVDLNDDSVNTSQMLAYRGENSITDITKSINDDKTNSAPVFTLNKTSKSAPKKDERLKSVIKNHLKIQTKRRREIQKKSFQWRRFEWSKDQDCKKEYIEPQESKNSRDRKPDYGDSGCQT